MADWSVIRAAIAAKAANVAGINEGTSTSLTGIGELPSIKVTHVEKVDMTDRGAGYEYREGTVRGELICAKPGTIGDAQQSVESLCELLTIEFRTGVQLGYAGTVQDCALTAWEMATITYGATEYPGASLTWLVRVRENVTRAA